MSLCVQNIGFSVRRLVAVGRLVALGFLRRYRTEGAAATKIPAVSGFDRDDGAASLGAT